MSEALKPTETYSAYWYSLDSTGVEAIDAILKAVASAGRSYHNTEDWTEIDDNGKSEIDYIQEAANEAARLWNERRAQ